MKVMLFCTEKIDDVMLEQNGWKKKEVAAFTKSFKTIQDAIIELDSLQIDLYARGDKLSYVKSGERIDLSGYALVKCLYPELPDTPREAFQMLADCIKQINNTTFTVGNI